MSSACSRPASTHSDAHRSRLDTRYLAAEFCAAIAEDELRVIEATPHDYRRMAVSLTTYASLRLQVVDACVIALAERLDVREVAALDRRDFLVVAPRHLRKGAGWCADASATTGRALDAPVQQERTGHAGARFAADERVSSKLSTQWLDALRGCMNVYPQGDLDDALGAVPALHAAGVDILTGTDVSGPDPAFGGMAHGASVHHELQLLVTAGLTPVQALRAATATPARGFGLTDRGRITPGARADLLLVDGDPTTTIADTLSIRAVWRRGVRQTPA